MNTQKADHLLESLTLRSPVSLLLRVLCAISCDVVWLDGDAGAFSMEREQIFALLERRGGDMAIRDVPSLVPSGHNDTVRQMGESTSVLCISSEGTRVTTLAKIRFRQDEGVYPLWWEIPLPLVRYDGKNVACNKEGRKRFGSRPFVAPAEEGDIPGEYFARSATNDSVVFVLRLLEAEYYTIEDVTEDMKRADDILWWASVGKALCLRMTENGSTVERVLENGDVSAGDIPCVWEDKVVGYLKIGDKRKRK